MKPIHLILGGAAVFLGFMLLRRRAENASRMPGGILPSENPFGGPPIVPSVETPRSATPVKGMCEKVFAYNDPARYGGSGDKKIAAVSSANNALAKVNCGALGLIETGAGIVGRGALGIAKGVGSGAVSVGKTVGKSTVSVVKGTTKLLTGVVTAPFKIGASTKVCRGDNGKDVFPNDMVACRKYAGRDDITCNQCSNQYDKAAGRWIYNDPYRPSSNVMGFVSSSIMGFGRGAGTPPKG